MVGERWCVCDDAEMPGCEKNYGGVTDRASSKGRQEQTASREKTNGASNANALPRGSLGLECSLATWALVMSACAMRS